MINVLYLLCWRRPVGRCSSARLGPPRQNAAPPPPSAENTQSLLCRSLAGGSNDQASHQPANEHKCTRHRRQ
eukprot:15437294-Alexandrium_andersonii.AAC.1